MYSDPIADYLTRIRNAAKAGHSAVVMPASRMKEEMSRVLKETGFIRDYRRVSGEPQPSLTVFLKYGRDKRCAINSIRRKSRPGLRCYVGVEQLPRVLNGLGVAILSTSRGVMTNQEAGKLRVGGEVLCEVY